MAKTKAKNKKTKEQEVPLGAHALSQNPKNALYQRCSDCLCAHCNEEIGERLFRIAMNETHGFEAVVHHDCYAAYRKADEDNDYQERLEDNKKRCQAYIDTKDGVAEGGRNETAAKKICPIGLDFDLDEDEFWPILQSWNAKNQPPLSDRELRRTLFSANRSRQSHDRFKATSP